MKHNSYPQIHYPRTEFGIGDDHTVQLCTDKPSVRGIKRSLVMAKLVKLNGKKWYVRVWLKDQRKYKFIPTNSNNKVDNKRLLKRYNEKEADIVAGLSKSIDEQSIQNAKERWIKDRRYELVEGSIVGYELAMKDFLNVVNGNRKVSNLHPQDLLNLKAYYFDVLKVDPVTINNRLRSLKAFLNWCLEQKYIDSLPFKIKKVKEPSKEPRVFTSDEFQTILKNTDDGVMKSYFRFCYFTGMRIGEINATEWIIDNDRNYIKITKSKREESSNRVQPVESSLRSDWEMIKAHLYRENRVTKAFTKAAKISGSYVKNRKTLHALRHSYGNEWVKSGKPLAVLSKLLGHSSIKVTNDFYIDADPRFFENHVANA